MHLSLILCAVGVACCVRLFSGSGSIGSGSIGSSSIGSRRWQQTLGLFLFSPVLLLVTAVAVLQMGKAGRMLGLPVGEMGFSCALSFLGLAAGCLLWRLGQAGYSAQKVRQYPIMEVQNSIGYLLDIDLPFAAQVGFWQSHLVISRGLLAHLSSEHIAAVLTHEQAHAYYRDTFWFFWLGWLRQLTAWLPHTERLWQELLLLREMRADRWAANHVDALLVAEALLQMTQLPLLDLENSCAAMGSGSSSRLEERIEALLSPAEPIAASEASNGSPVHALPWGWLLLTLVPLFTVALHH